MSRLGTIAILLLLWSGFLAGSAVAQAVPQSREQIRLSYAPLVKKTAPAVVNIYTSTLVKQRLLPPLFDDPIFRQFFGNVLPPGMTRERMENSLGSGVLVRADGLIVTSAHVIEGADEIRVVLSDRREFEATIVTVDEKTDLAVLRIKNSEGRLPYLVLADSDTVETGDLVIAIGNPFGVGQTVTSGIVSALARTGVSDSGYFIQTDAAINPGNSGGALVDMGGRLLGINAAIVSPNGGNLGIGFAVPANMVRTVVAAVEQGKKRVVRPWLGMALQNITPDLAHSLGLARPSGVLVKSLHPASPAYRAGIAVGDAILALNGKTVDDSETLLFRIATAPVDSTATMSVVHKGVLKNVSLNLIAPPESPPRQATLLKGRSPFGGATVVNISPAVVEEMSLPDVVALKGGVVLASVKPGSLAQNMGFAPGDIILVLNGQKIGSVIELQGAIASAYGGWQIRIGRGDRILNLVL